MSYLQAENKKQHIIKRSVLLILVLIIGVEVYGQTGNVIIQVNDRLVTNQIGKTYVKINDGGIVRSFDIDYVPGKLTISDKVWEFVENDTIGVFNLHFDYYTSKRQSIDLKNFEIKLSKALLSKEYLIINIYDFRSRKYRKWYGPYTDEEYLTELRYPNGPMYIRYK